MVIMLNPYTGGEMTVSVSNVERLAQTGWIVIERTDLAAPVAPQGQVTEEEPGPVSEVEEPDPAGGKPKGNASRAAWRDYAASLGIDVEGLNRAQIRDAVAEHEAD